MQMPDMDGMQLATAIRAQRSANELPLVLLTSLGRRATDMYTEHLCGLPHQTDESITAL